ncbi:hypothetical protein [Edaphobacter dinghuensis]|uniref:Uncharacterized protein n=1 Tax=Edaphobacter dinghuensis TaxID=1560005 RepID=A0A917H4G5_9BACT|nr:hypothetical protein [Edaphobacter dinghuensis]GGG66903.1 hypothetical protein GCM10011585_05970 [Edaphobacter dinghuensis]
MVDEGQGVVQRSFREQDAREMQEGKEALVRDEGEERGRETGGEDPEAVVSGVADVAGDKETFCLGRSDTAESDERDDDTAI